MLKNNRAPTLQEKTRKNKNAVKQPMSVLSVPSKGYLVKLKMTKNLVRCAYIPTDNTDIGCFTNKNSYPTDYPRPLNRVKRKNGVNLPMSVLSVPSRGYLVKLRRTKNLVKNAYTPTDNTDIGYFTSKNLYPTEQRMI